MPTDASATTATLATHEPPLVICDVNKELDKPDVLTVELPDSVLPGDYLLSVITQDGYGTYDLTVGAVGPVGPQGLQGIQGPKGDKGDTGDQGLQGDKGDTGDQGLQGEQGQQGIQGLQGDQGLQGIQGLKGDKGDKGDTGDQGPAGIGNFSTGTLGLVAPGPNGTTEFQDFAARGQNNDIYPTFCAISEYTIYQTDDSFTANVIPPTKQTCRVYPSGGTWRVEAYAGVQTIEKVAVPGFSVSCTARCMWVLP